MRDDGKGGQAERRTDRARGIPTATAVDHVGFNVPDLDAAVAFFTTVFGLDLLEQAEPRRTGPDGQTTVRLAMLRYGDGALVELLEFRRPDQPWTIAAMREPGGYHLAFTVTDLDAAIAYLKAQPGVEVGEPDQLPAGRRRVFFTTPWGMPVQLITPGTGQIF